MSGPSMPAWVKRTDGSYEAGHITFKLPARFTLVLEIEKILFRRLMEKRFEGYTLETATEVADTVIDMFTTATVAEPGSPVVTSSD